MPSSLIVKNGRIIDPDSGFDQIADVFIKNGRIIEMGSNIHVESPIETINASGMIVAPGFIDIHTHLREPGFEHKETIASGTASAIAGGFTSIACMANTNPINDSVATTRLILQKAKESGKANVFPIASVTLGLKGQKLSPLDALKKTGAVAFSDDGNPVWDESLMALALEGAKSLDVPVISHCEVRELAPQGVMNEGPFSKKLGLKGIPNESEDRIVERDIRLAGKTGAHIHIAHISTAGAVNKVRKAKKNGIKVTCEVTPHHFTLTDESVSRVDTNTKMSPPPRSRKDVEAVLEGLADGTIDAIATDHAPHSPEEKSAGFEKAPFGIVGLETALPLVLNLVRDKVIDLQRAIALLTLLPAKILRLNKGKVFPGADADITIFDPIKEWTVNPDSFKSKGRNTPFDGWEVKGKVCYTIINGNSAF